MIVRYFYKKICLSALSEMEEFSPQLSSKILSTPFTKEDQEKTTFIQRWPGKGENVWGSIKLLSWQQKHHSLHCCSAVTTVRRICRPLTEEHHVVLVPQLFHSPRRRSENQLKHEPRSDDFQCMNSKHMGVNFMSSCKSIPGCQHGLSFRYHHVIFTNIYMFVYVKKHEYLIA